jgi:hypothetical protein
MLRETRGKEIPLGICLPRSSQVQNIDLRKKNMEPSISVVTAMLYSVAYSTVEYGTPTVPEAEFVPFDLSQLRDFGAEPEQSRNQFGGHVQNAPNALPA